jgi:hypothetical protein
MDKSTIKAEAIKALESVKFYSYSNDALDAAVESGIPEGAMIMNQGGLKVVREGNNAVGRNEKGIVIKTIPLTGDFADKAAIMYAVTMARTPIKVGI